jgi:hypothetical protein
MKRIIRFNDLIVAALLILCSGFLFSCQTEGDSLDNDVSEAEVVELFTNSTAADDAVEFEIELSYIAQDELSGLKSGRERSKLPDCAIVTKDSINKVLTIDFGDGCKGPRGKLRKGKIIINYNGDMEAKIVARVISFSEYFVDGKKIGGIIKLTKSFENESANLISERTLKDFTVTSADGNVMKTNGTHTREWLEGYGDDDENNNVVRLSGFMQGVSTKGRAFKNEIVTPVILSYSCASEGGFLRVAGTVKMAVGKLDENGDKKGFLRVVDYGDGSCDKEFTVTVFGKEKVVTKKD